MSGANDLETGTSSAVCGLAFDALWVTFGGYSAPNIWKSTNLGGAWSPIDGSGTTTLPAAPIYDLKFLSTNESFLYLAAEIGLFTSADGGAHWLPQQGPANVPVEQLAWLGPTTLVAATHGRGMFQATVGGSPAGVTVAGIVPASGSIAGGSAVTIIGDNFASGATVTIGGVAAANVTLLNATAIAATITAHAAGLVSVMVTNPDTQNRHTGERIYLCIDAAMVHAAVTAFPTTVARRFAGVVGARREGRHTNHTTWTPTLTSSALSSRTVVEIMNERLERANCPLPNTIQRVGRKETIMVTTTSEGAGFVPLTREDFEAAYAKASPHIHHTPLLSSRLLSEATGFEVRLKAEMFQRTGSYKIRGPLNKFTYLTEEERRRGVVCSSAGNHAQGVALAAKIHGIKAVVCMAENATPSKIAATRAYGAEVVLHGTIWDEANEKAKELVRARGLTYVHPFDDMQLIAGQGTLGLEIIRDWPDVDVIVVPIGGGGLISGVAQAVKAFKPSVRVIGVESSGAPGMRDSIRAGHVVTLDTVDCIIDGLRVKRVGSTTFEVVRRFVDEIVTLPDEQIFEAMIWIMGHAKLVVEGAAASPVAALLQGLIKAPGGSKVACVLSGGNVNLDQLKGLRWN